MHNNDMVDESKLGPLEQPNFNEKQEEQFELPNYLNISKEEGDQEETMFAVDNLLIDAAQAYILKLDQFLNYDIQTNPAIVSGDIHMLQFEDKSNYNFQQNWICLHSQSFRVFRK